MSIKGSAGSYIKLKGSISIPTAIVGKSAYEVAVANGFDGTEAEWLASLKGEKGATGEKGDKGDKGDRGEKGESGADGKTPTKGVDYFDGQDGKTPVKGVDYFTESEVKAITADIEAKLAELEERLAKLEGSTPEEPEEPVEYVISAGNYACDMQIGGSLSEEWEARLNLLVENGLENALPVSLPIEGSSYDCEYGDFVSITIGEDANFTFHDEIGGSNVDYDDPEDGTSVYINIAENQTITDPNAYAIFTTLFKAMD